MRLRLYILAFWLFVLPLCITMSCHRCADQKYFSVIDLFIENGRILGEAPMVVDPMTVNEHIKIGKYCIKLTTGLEYSSLYPTSFPSSSFFVNTALANCATSEDPLPAHRISSFKIVSNADFILTNEIFVPANEPLNNYFVVSYNNVQRIPLSDFLNSEESHPMEIPIFLFINGDPAYNQLHRFSVNYTLDDGQAFSAMTEKVIITPN